MYIENAESKMQKAIENMEARFTNVRAGRANPAMLNGINVEYYGASTPLNQVANITVPEARQLSIKPFDKSILGDIEKAINEGADSLGAVQQATKAGAGCGRCSANVEKVTLELLKENK